MRKEVNQTRDEFWNLATLLFSKKLKTIITIQINEKLGGIGSYKLKLYLYSFINYNFIIYKIYYILWNRKYLNY